MDRTFLVYIMASNSGTLYTREESLFILLGASYAAVFHRLPQAMTPVVP